MRTILVVDDDPNTREVLCRLLEAEGYHCVGASNGWEALLAVEDHHISLILLDVMMPGMDGVTFLKILRGAQSKQATPVVVVTALGLPEIRERTRNLGIAEFLPKTRALYDKLVEVVHRHLGDEGKSVAQIQNSN